MFAWLFCCKKQRETNLSIIYIYIYISIEVDLFGLGVNMNNLSHLVEKYEHVHPTCGHPNNCHIEV